MDAPSATLDPGVNWRLGQQCTSTQVYGSGRGRGETGLMAEASQTVKHELQRATRCGIKLKSGQISVERHVFLFLLFGLMNAGL